jgi:hypothetical protein
MLAVDGVETQYCSTQINQCKFAFTNPVPQQQIGMRLLDAALRLW